MYLGTVQSLGLLVVFPSRFERCRSFTLIVPAYRFPELMFVLSLDNILPVLYTPTFHSSHHAGIQLAEPCH